MSLQTQPPATSPAAAPDSPSLSRILPAYWPALLIVFCQVVVMYTVVHFGVGLQARYPTATVAFLLLTSVYPLIYSLWLSFHSWNMTIPNSKPVWIGTRNYERLWDDPDFWNSVKVTLIFVIVAVTVEFIFGMGLALLATRFAAAREKTLYFAALLSLIAVACFLTST